MAQSEITYNNKTNQIPIQDRDKQATAEDFNEIKQVVNDNAQDVETRIGQASNAAKVVSTFSSVQTSGDPGAGNFRINATKTELYINHIQNQGSNIRILLQTLIDGSNIKLESSDNKFKVLFITDKYTDNGLWSTIPIFVNNEGTAFDDGDVCGILFVNPGEDGDAIHDNKASEINLITEKVAPVGDDIVLIEDSEDSFNKKKVKKSNFGSTDVDAIHDNVADEINQISEKTNVVNDDLFLIEDSEDSLNKKKVKASNVPGAPDGDHGFVQFKGVDGKFDSNLQLFWDNTNNRFGVGTNVPLGAIHIGGLIAGKSGLEGGLVFGDGDTGIYEGIDDRLNFALAGADVMVLNQTTVDFSDSNNPRINLDAANGDPILVFTRADSDTGIGRSSLGGDTVALIAGGVEALSVVESPNGTWWKMLNSTNDPDSAVGGIHLFAKDDVFKYKRFNRISELAVNSAEIKLRFDNDTTSGNPGGGNFRFNAGKTELYVSYTEEQGGNIKSLISKISNGSSIKISSESDKYSFLNATGDITDNGTWALIPISVDNEGTAYLDNDLCGVLVIGGGGKESVITNEQPVASLKFDKNYMPDESIPLDLSTGDKTLLLNTGITNVVGNFNYFDVIADGVHRVIQGTGFKSNAIFPSDLFTKDNGVLAAGTYRFYTQYSANGIEINAPGLEVGDGGDTTPLTILNSMIDGGNIYVDVIASKGMFGDALATSGVDENDFEVRDFSQNGDVVTGITLTNASKIDGGATLGGETVVRLTLSLTGGSSTGLATFRIGAIASSVYDVNGTAMADTEETPLMTLRSAETLVSAITPSNGTTGVAANTSIVIDFSAPVQAIGAAFTAPRIEAGVVILREGNEDGQVIKYDATAFSTTQITCQPVSELSNGQVIHVSVQNYERISDNKIFYDRTTAAFTCVFNSVTIDGAAFKTAAGITDPTEVSAIDTLVSALNTKDYRHKLQAVYPLIGSSETGHKFNLIDPQDLDASFRLAFPNGATHAYEGIFGDGSTQYINTFVNALSGLKKHNFHVGIYYNTGWLQQDNYYLSGAYVGNTERLDIQLDANEQLELRAYDDTQNVGTTDGGRINAIIGEIEDGIYLFSSSPTERLRMFKDTGLISSGNNKQTGTQPNLSLYALSRNSNGSPNTYDHQRIAFLTIGEGLTNAEWQDYFSLIDAFQTTLGRKLKRTVSYQPDFAAGVITPATLTDLTPTYNQDGISDGTTSFDDCVELVATGSSRKSYDFLGPEILASGKYYFIDMWVYIPATNTVWTGLNFNSNLKIPFNPFLNNVMPNEWTRIQFYLKSVNDNDAFFRARTSAGSEIFVPGAGDKMWMHGLTVYEV